MFKKINGKYEHKFAVDKDGLYSISIEATCQKRNDLSVGIDEIKLRELPAEDKIQYYKIPPSWNGNELKGTSKTVVLILELLQGEHILKFEAEGEAELLAEPITNFLERKSLITVLENIQSPKKNRQPWITAVLINLPLKYLDISATCQKRFLDSDDLQLIIDGEIQKHPSSLWWGKNWLWQGRLSKGVTQTKRIYKKLDRGIHYIELWADVAPVLNSFQLGLGAESIPGDEKDESWWMNWKEVKKYNYKGTFGDENYNRYDNLIRGAVANWNREFFSQEYPPDEPLDPNLVKAMIYQESRVGYDEDNNGAINVMQVGNQGDDSLNILNGKGEGSEYELINGKIWRLSYEGKAKVNGVYDSVYWGVRWLYHKAQEVGTDNKRYWSSWKKAVAAYGPLNDKYAENIWSIYTTGVDKRNTSPIFLWGLLMLIMFSGLGLFGFCYHNRIEKDVFGGLSSKDKAYTQDIKIKHYWEDPALFLAEIITYEDWSEDFRIGHYMDGKIVWLTIDHPPEANSISSARFVNLAGFKNPLIEVYAENHRGTGLLWLYAVDEEKDRANLLLETFAIDKKNDGRWAPDNFEKYGYTECGEIFKDGKLKTNYKDLNGDGITDVVLSGEEDVVCFEEYNGKDDWAYTNIKVAESDVRKVFLWDKEKRRFLDQTQVALGD